MMYPVDRIVDNLRVEDDRFRNLWEMSTQEQREGILDAIMDALLSTEDDPDDDPDDEGGVEVYLSKEEWMGNAFS
jgi:hypothetical protein